MFSFWMSVVNQFLVVFFLEFLVHFLMVIYPGPGKENVLQSEMETVKFKKFMRKVLVKKN